MSDFPVAGMGTGGSIWLLHRFPNSTERPGSGRAGTSTVSHNIGKLARAGGPAYHCSYSDLIIATGHNNLAMGRSIEQVAKHFVNGKKLEEGMLNRVSAVVRAYDPCLSCSTHALNQPALEVRLLDADGSLLDTLRQ